MTTPKTVWAVSSGSYSDYRVSYVCATKEIAERICEGLNAGSTYHYDDFEPEEFPYVDAQPEIVTLHTYSFYSAHGTEYRVKRRVLSHEAPKRPKVSEARPNPTVYSLEVSGRNEAAVEKAFQDRISAWRLST